MAMASVYTSNNNNHISAFDHWKDTRTNPQHCSVGYNLHAYSDHISRWLSAISIEPELQQQQQPTEYCNNMITYSSICFFFLFTRFDKHIKHMKWKRCDARRKSQDGAHKLQYLRIELGQDFVIDFLFRIDLFHFLFHLFRSCIHINTRTSQVFHSHTSSTYMHNAHIRFSLCNSNIYFIFSNFVSFERYA